jgi:hypothetical protein
MPVSEANLLRQPQTCCQRWLNKYDAFPWRISRLETALHLIPGVGCITSFVGWAIRERQAKSLEGRIEQLEDTRVDELENPFLAPNQEVKREMQKQLLLIYQAKRNCSLIFWCQVGPVFLGLIIVVGMASKGYINN